MMSETLQPLEVQDYLEKSQFTIYGQVLCPNRRCYYCRTFILGRPNLKKALSANLFYIMHLQNLEKDEKKIKE